MLLSTIIDQPQFDTSKRLSNESICVINLINVVVFNKKNAFSFNILSIDINK